MPILRVAAEVFAGLAGHRFAAVGDGWIAAAGQPFDPGVMRPPGAPTPAAAELSLSASDRADLAGERGEARRIAMRVIARIAALAGARQLLDVTRAHLDCCIYTGPSSIAVVEHFRDRGGRFAVPTTLNAISTDLRPDCAAAAAPALSAASARQTQGFIDMGATPTFTCAPYLLDPAPTGGEHLGWAESNAVMFANSVLGARTEKYPDYLDLCVALTGRAPLAGCHLEARRAARIVIAVSPPPDFDDSFWPLLGHVAGELSPHRIPVLTGLEDAKPSHDDLKAFCAAFATTSAAPMAHIAGITPEAPDAEAALQGRTPEAIMRIDRDILAEAWGALNGDAEAIGLVALGNPHLSAAEIGALDRLVAGRRRADATALVITTSRAVLADVERAGLARGLAAFGARFVADTCWCMLGRPVTPPAAGAVMTNSGKYAHYGPGLTGGVFRFGSLAACVDAACDGRAACGLPDWLA
jgi:hypothetical protein